MIPNAIAIIATNHVAGCKPNGDVLVLQNVYNLVAVRAFVLRKILHGRSIIPGRAFKVAAKPIITCMVILTCLAFSFNADAQITMTGTAPGSTGNNACANLIDVEAVRPEAQDQTDLDITPSDLTENVIVGESTDLQVLLTIIDDPHQQSNELLSSNLENNSSYHSKLKAETKKKYVRKKLRKYMAFTFIRPILLQ